MATWHLEHQPFLQVQGQSLPPEKLGQWPHLMSSLGNNDSYSPFRNQDPMACVCVEPEKYCKSENEIPINWVIKVFFNRTYFLRKGTLCMDKGKGQSPGRQIGGRLLSGLKSHVSLC